MRLSVAASPLRRPITGGDPRDLLVERPPFSHGPESSRLFLEAMRRSLEHHRAANPAFGGICRAEGFRTASLRSEEDVPRVPFIFVGAFKVRDLVSVPPRLRVLELTSSGTSGQRSRIVLDSGSLLRVRRMAWKVFEALGLADPGPADHLCLTYDPAVAKSLGTAFTDRLLTGLAGQGETFYALRWDADAREFRFDVEGAVAALARFESGGRAVRVLGFPAFVLRLCAEFRARRGRGVRLPPGSCVITGGGWKDQQERAVGKGVLRLRLARGLGLPVHRVRDLFGMVEHGVPYVDCRLGRFHIPVYARVLVRDPGSLRPLPAGRAGLLQFMTPYLTSYPSISLLSSDLGRTRPRCGCGIPGPVLEVVGRAGVSKLKGCAVSAASML